ncbi:MAG: C69 family dipeptidase [Bacteroidales bacterium]
MRKHVIAFSFLMAFLMPVHLLACTNVIVTKGASAKGSAFLAYTNDAEYIYHLYTQAAADYAQKETISFTNRAGVTGEIPQTNHTYKLLGFHMNEHQLAIGETTFTGREELWNQEHFLEYWHLMKLALERAKTAREAVEVMTTLAETHGYGSEGESFSILGKKEAWILEMIGTGKGNKGAIWVARKIPDGMISAHANKARIGKFPLDDPDNCLYSDNVIEFAVENGYYNPDSEKPFRFNEVYCPSTPANLRYCSARVWSIFRRAAPSLNLSPDYHRGVQGAERYPLWIKPDEKIQIADMMHLVRDHYEGTDFDMTKGYSAGPFGNPNKNRPLVWEVDSVQCSWERPISTYNSAFTFIAQIRPCLPDETGGLVWFGVDDSYVTCYVPLANSITRIPEAFRTGDIRKFSWKSAWWVFNFVGNYANLRYKDMIVDIQAVQDSIENHYINEQPTVDKKATALLNKNKNAGIEYMTKLAETRTENLMKRWIQLGQDLITKYNDGYVKDEQRRPRAVNYPVQYRRNVLKYEPERRLPVWDDAAKEAKEPQAY